MSVVLALLMTACLAFVAGACWEHLRVDGSRDLAVRLDRTRRAMRAKREQAADDFYTWEGPATWQ